MDINKKQDSHPAFLLYVAYTSSKTTKKQPFICPFQKTYYLCTAKTVEWFDNFCSTCISNYDYQYVGVIPFLLKETRLGF